MSGRPSARPCGSPPALLDGVNQGPPSVLEQGTHPEGCRTPRAGATGFRAASGSGLTHVVFWAVGMQAGRRWAKTAKPQGHQGQGAQGGVAFLQGLGLKAWSRGAQGKAGAPHGNLVWGDLCRGVLGQGGQGAGWEPHCQAPAPTPLSKAWGQPGGPGRADGSRRHILRQLQEVETLTQAAACPPCPHSDTGSNTLPGSHPDTQPYADAPSLVLMRDVSKHTRGWLLRTCA